MNNKSVSMNNKSVSVMLAILACMVLSLRSVGVVSAQTVSISPTTVTSPAVGGEFTVQLEIANGNQVAGYEAAVNFDTSALRYVRSANGSYLPAGAFVVPPIEEVGSVKVGATALGGSSNGDGTLASVTFAVVSVKSSQLTLTDVLVVDSTGRAKSPRLVNGQVVAAVDVNGDGRVDIVDLALVAARLGTRGQNSADVNADRVVNILDLVLVARRFGTTSGGTTAPPVVDTPPPAPNGLLAEVYTPGGSLRELPNFDWLIPVQTLTTANIDLPDRRGDSGFFELGIDLEDDFAIRFRGKLMVETAGTHIFKIQSDDGAQVYVNGELIVDNDGPQDFTTASGAARLTAGLHDIEIRYFQGLGNIGLQLFWWPPDQPEEEIVPPEVLYLPDIK